MSDNKVGGERFVNGEENLKFVFVKKFLVSKWFFFLKVIFIKFFKVKIWYRYMYLIYEY